ncbi:MAG: asparagine synthase-related protein, partial [Solirubrobacteraceae bacterium]
VQVMLDGQSGDEIFGPALYLAGDRLRAGQLPSAVQLFRHGLASGSAGLPWRRTLRLLGRYAVAPLLPGPLQAALHGRHEPRHRAPDFMTDDAARLLAASTDELRFTRGAADGPLWWLHLRQLLIDDCEAAGLGDFTRQRSRWAGLEGRPPLFDVELIETALRIAPEYRFDPHLDRPIGRAAMAGLMPDEVRLSRRKSNLAPFYHRGLTGPDLAAIRQLLGYGRLEIERWVRPQVVRELLEHPPAARSGTWLQWQAAIWGCLTVECWLRSLGRPTFAEEMLERGDAAPLQASAAA